MQELATSYNPYPDRRRRAAELIARYAFAAEVLGFYAELLAVQEQAYLAASSAPPPPAAAAAYAVFHVLHRVVGVTAAAGPAPLAEATSARFHAADLEDVAGRWLRGEEQSPTDRFLARAAVTPILEALGPRSGAACSDRQDRGCPHCGGTPQLAYFGLTGEELVLGPRYLLCSRCQSTWPVPASSCPLCGESTSSRLPVFSEDDQFPAARLDGCESCKRYLISFDLRREVRIVPVVDELACIPLDLFARERGLRKATPNLMGF